VTVTATHAAFGCCAGQSPGDFPSSDPSPYVSLARFRLVHHAPAKFPRHMPLFSLACPPYLQAAHVVCSEAKVRCRRGVGVTLKGFLPELFCCCFRLIVCSRSSSSTVTIRNPYRTQYEPLAFSERGTQFHQITAMSLSFAPRAGPSAFRRARTTTAQMMPYAVQIRWSRKFLIEQLALGHSKCGLQDFKLAATASLALTVMGSLFSKQEQYVRFSRSCQQISRPLYLATIRRTRLLKSLSTEVIVINPFPALFRVLCGFRQGESLANEGVARQHAVVHGCRR